MINKASMQTFGKGGANFRCFTYRVCVLGKLILMQKIRGVNSVSGEKLHEFGMI